MARPRHQLDAFPLPADGLVHRTKSAYVETALREAIVTGALEPDQHVPQEEIARRLGVSATPVREAIRRLEAEGLLHNQPHRGVTVAVPSRADLVDIYWARSGLEGAMTWLVVDRTSPDERATLVARLRDLQAGAEEAVNSGDLRSVPRLNRDFHYTIYEAAGARRLLESIRQHWALIPHYFIWRLPGRAASGIALHRPIIEAIAVGDSDVAEATMRRHIRLGGQSLFQSLAENENVLWPKSGNWV